MQKRRQGGWGGAIPGRSPSEREAKDSDEERWEGGENVALFGNGESCTAEGGGKSAMQIWGGGNTFQPHPSTKKVSVEGNVFLFLLYCDVPEMPLLDPHLEEVRRPVVVPPLCLNGLDHDPCYGHAPALPLLDGLLHGGQAAVVLRTVLALVLAQRVAVAGEVGAGPRAQGRDVDAVDGPGEEWK